MCFFNRMIEKLRYRIASNRLGIIAGIHPTKGAALFCHYLYSRFTPNLLNSK